MKKFSKGTGLVLSAVALASAVPGAALADIDKLPENRGFNVGGVANVSPFFTLNFLYDDNPQNAREGKKKVWKEAWDLNKIEDKENAERDPFKEAWGYSFTPGVDITIPGNAWQLIGRIKYTKDIYDCDEVDDRDDWSESLTLSGETEGGLAWNIGELVRQSIYDSDYEYGDDDRLEYQVTAGLSKRISEKTTLGISGSYLSEDFDDDTLHDHVRYGGRVNFARKLTDKTSWTLTASHTITKQDDFVLVPYGDKVREYTREERGDKEAQSTRFLVGLTTQSDEKLSFDIRVGLENYKGFENAEGERDTERTITYELGANWKFNERLSFILSGNGQYEPSEDIDSNSTDTKTVRLSALYRIGEDLRLRAGVGYTIEDYEHKIVKVTDEWKDARDYKTSGNDSDGSNRDDKKFNCNFGASYSVNEYASLFADLTYTKVTSSIDYFDYERLRASLGLALRY